MGTAIAVSFLWFTPTWAAVYTILTQETDAGRSVRLGLEEVQSTHSRSLLWRAFARKLRLRMVPKVGPVDCRVSLRCGETVLQDPPQKEHTVSHWSWFFMKKVSSLR